MLKHLTIKLYGRVQNVGFRANTKKAADRLGVNGTATNLSDGSVLIEAEAHEDRLQEFVDWCKSGPDHARVEKYEITEDVVVNYQSFSIM